MILPKEDGGFDGARDEDGNVLISETKLRRIWPNWIVPMTERYKTMCACTNVARQQTLKNRVI